MITRVCRSRALGSKRAGLVLTSLAWVLVLLSACSHSQAPRVAALLPVPEHGVCRIAVLPFSNESKYPRGGLLFYKVFAAELVRTGQFDVVQEGDVRELYEQLHLLPGQEPTLEQVKIMGNRLGVEAVVLGTVLQMKEHRERTGADPSLAIFVKILDARTGETLWTTYHRRQGSQFRKVMHFGMVYTLTSLAQRVSNEVLDVWLKKGLHGCEG